MIEALFEGLTLVLQWKPLAFMMLGIVLGFWVGLLPGLGGATTLALMLPFIYAMQPVEAFAFLLGMHAVVATTGDITSVLFGVPGEAASAATILDGHAMAKKGEAGRALGAALASSLVGAVVGAFALAIAIPMVRPLVLTFGSPELFMLAIVGIAFIASLSAPGVRGMVRGFLPAGWGCCAPRWDRIRRPGSRAIPSTRSTCGAASTSCRCWSGSSPSRRSSTSRSGALRSPERCRPGG